MQSHRRHRFSAARRHHFLARTGRVDAARRLARRWLSSRHHVPSEYDQEDAGKMNARALAPAATGEKIES